MKVTVLLSILIAISSAKVPYECQVERARQVCSELVRELVDARPIRVAGFVRLVFHDCVGSGGCNGCMDLSNGDNAGLARYIDPLEEAFTADLQEGMSRADFWVLCAHEALKEGFSLGSKETGDELNLNMVFGRPDCGGSSPNVSANDSYPNPHNGYEVTTDYFNQEFNLTDNQTIALLGAHTLGRANQSFSGFQNPWVDNEFGLDNRFYVDILNRELNWTQKILNTAHPNDTSFLQYVRQPGDQFLMFSSDMCLAWNITSSKDNPGSVGDTLPSTQSPGYNLVQEYATNNGKWLTDFAVAFQKMVEKRAVEVTTPLSPASPDGDAEVCKQYITTGSPQTSPNPTPDSTTSSASRLSLFGLW